MTDRGVVSVRTLFTDEEINRAIDVAIERIWENLKGGFRYDPGTDCALFFTLTPETVKGSMNEAEAFEKAKLPLGTVVWYDWNCTDEFYEVNEGNYKEEIGSWLRHGSYGTYPGITWEKYVDELVEGD